MKMKLFATIAILVACALSSSSFLGKSNAQEKPKNTATKHVKTGSAEVIRKASDDLKYLTIDSMNGESIKSMIRAAGQKTSLRTLEISYRSFQTQFTLKPLKDIKQLKSLTVHHSGVLNQAFYDSLQHLPSLTSLSIFDDT